MAEKLLMALLNGHYVPDMEYTFPVPAVPTGGWGVDAWARWVTPYPLEAH